jgi:hypothetical protein
MSPERLAKNGGVWFKIRLEVPPVDVRAFVKHQE